MNLTDREILMDLLYDAKMISMGYHTATLESASDRVRNTLMQIHNDELNAHKQMFDMAHSRGYYPVEPARMAMTGTYGSTVGMGMMGQQSPIATGTMGSMGLGGAMGSGMTGSTMPGQNMINPGMSNTNTFDMSNPNMTGQGIGRTYMAGNQNSFNNPNRNL